MQPNGCYTRACARREEPNADYAAGILLEARASSRMRLHQQQVLDDRQLLEAISADVLTTSSGGWRRWCSRSRRLGGEMAWDIVLYPLERPTESRLSVEGKRRLGELQRKFEQDEPPEPMGIVVGPVRSPIPPAAAEHMTDEQWLGAIAKYSTETTGMVTELVATRTSWRRYWKLRRSSTPSASSPWPSGSPRRPIPL